MPRHKWFMTHTLCAISGKEAMQHSIVGVSRCVTNTKAVSAMTMTRVQQYMRNRSVRNRPPVISVNEIPDEPSSNITNHPVERRRVSGGRRRGPAVKRMSDTA